MTPDHGREAVYASEIAAFEGTAYEEVVALDQLLQLVDDIVAGEWWPHGRVDVRAARSDARSSSTRQRGGGRPVVRLAGPQMTPATVLHEMAHVLAGLAAGHGPTFRRAHVDLVDSALGERAARWLLDAYARMGLAPGERAWPAPPARREACGPTAL
jgi:hypothetical protein